MFNIQKLQKLQKISLDWSFKDHRCKCYGVYSLKLHASETSDANN